MKPVDPEEQELVALEELEMELTAPEELEPVA